MATLTPNFNLSKPDSSDQFDAFRQSYNDNMDIIDNNLGGGGGGGGHTIVDENGSDMPAESKLQFTGNVNVADDNVNGATVVDILGGGGNVYGAFIDTDRTISSGTITAGVEGTYTATEDVAIDFLLYASGGQNAYLRIDGKNIYSSNSGTNRDFVFLKKGQTATFGSYGTNGTYTVYGLLQGTNGIFAPVIYSDNERVIGVWRDNKPLYQRSFDLGSDKSISHTSWYNAIVSIPNVENITLCFGLYSGGTYYPLMAYHTGDDVNVLACRANSGATVRYLTLRYTKSSDTAGSGTWNTSGIPNVHYSSTEHVIGTWIDGKPIYEITVDTGTLPNNTTKTIAHGISDLKAVIDLRGYALNTNNGINIPIPYVYKSGSYSKSLQAYADATNITFISGENMSGYTESYVTLQYTKSTD